MATGRPRIRPIIPVLFALVLIAALAAFPAPAGAAPAATCSEVTLVLDESGSLDPHEGIVRNALHAFLGELTDSGAAAAVVEFGTAANTVFGYTPITSTSVAATFTPYVDATASGDRYNPPSQSGPYTNWDDALDEVTQLNAADGVAPLVLFLTDGDPTAYNLDKSGESGGVHVNGVSTEAVQRAVEEAQEMSSQGSHLIAVGVGNALTSAASINRLNQVAGPDVYTGAGTFDLAATDVVLVPQFSDLPEAMTLIAQAMCADPAITVVKTVAPLVVVPGTSVTYTLLITNTGNVPLHDVEVTDPAVPACSTVIGTIAAGESVTITCTATIWAPLLNTATASGSDPFGNQVSDDDSAEIHVVSLGTGTPGYWKNHPASQPFVAESAVEIEMLVGDWNHNGVCDPAETCLALTHEEVEAALNTPPRGDMTWNLGRPLVAAWLNVSTGNDASCIATTLDAATAWLLEHPLGSGVGGGDPDWEQASAWAELLDDYNNGRLCAEHRDAGGGDEDEDSSTAGSDDDPEQAPGHGKRKGPP